jgi:hypothetical protein
MQYTLRDIPPPTDAELRRRRDLGDIAGTWQEDPELDQAIAEQDQIDERLWRQGAGA